MIISSPFKLITHFSTYPSTISLYFASSICIILHSLILSFILFSQCNAASLMSISLTNANISIVPLSSVFISGAFRRKCDLPPTTKYISIYLILLETLFDALKASENSGKARPVNDILLTKYRSLFCIRLSNKSLKVDPSNV